PNTLSPEMKASMRRLAGRIGALLAGKKAGGTTDASTPPTDGQPPVSITPSSTPSGAKTDDDDDIDDELDDEIEPGTTDDVDDHEDDDDAADESDEGTEEGERKDESGGVKTYQFQEALQQRLQRLKLKNKTSEITNPNKE